MLGFDPASQPKNQSIQRKSDCCVKRFLTEIALRGSSNRVRARDDRFFVKTTAFFLKRSPNLSKKFENLISIKTNPKALILF